MTAQRTWVSITAFLFTSLLIVGCLPTTSQISTTATRTSTVVPESETATSEPSATVELGTSTTPPTSSEPNATFTPTKDQSNLLLTYALDRSCEDCLYGLASSIFQIEVGCVFDEVPCFGATELLFEWDGWVSAIEWDSFGERLVFESEGNLFIANADGTNVLQIPSDPGSEYSPQWSPDASKIAYIYGSDVEPAQIRIYDLEAQESERILSEIYAPHSINWFPNGDFAVVSKVSETDWTEVISIIGSDLTTMSILPENADKFAHIGDLALSPDSSQLAFVGEKTISGEFTTDIYMTNITGGEVENLTGGLGYNFEPDWSPFGAWLAFSSNRTGDWNIFLVKQDGNQLQQITNSEADESYLAWRVTP